jgi:hypothetical protein
MKKKVILLITVAFSVLLIVGVFVTANANTTELQEAGLRPIGTIGCRGWSPPFGCFWNNQFRPGNAIHGPLYPEDDN